MRWERAQDPVTWTTVDNAMVDADLSARAQGLLLRWLRRPPGAEIDDIVQMVKRSKREGKTRLEGRDALFKASYELEEEGFLVREQDRAANGRYEWVVRIYSSPVHPDKRSNSEDRRRAPRVRAPQNRRSAPVPEKPELVDQEPADQESADQELSFKNSVKNSLSPLSRPTGDGLDAANHRERETATPDSRGTSETPREETLETPHFEGGASSTRVLEVSEGGASSTPKLSFNSVLSLSSASPESPPVTDKRREREAAAPKEERGNSECPRDPRDVDADRVVDAYVAALGRPLLNGSRGRLRAQAVQLLAAGLPVAWVAERAAEMPANGWTDLELHCERTRVPIPGQAGAPGPGGERRATPAEVEALRARLMQGAQL